ncbi:MAG: hypothetical protein IPL53_09450 [Ignavibacteria bacterium]|nr:hypothetical protein [Ignavibacteria bacterium]
MTRGNVRAVWILLRMSEKVLSCPDVPSYDPLEFLIYKNIPSNDRRKILRSTGIHSCYRK